MNKIMVLIQSFDKGKYFQPKEVYEYTSLVPVNCPDCNTVSCYTILIDGVTYNVPEDNCMTVSDADIEYLNDVVHIGKSGQPVIAAIDAFVERFDADVKKHIPDGDWQGAYLEFLNIDVMDDLIKKNYAQDGRGFLKSPGEQENI